MMFIIDVIIQAAFEEMCSVYGERVEFHYLPSFRRIRVTYGSPEEAVGARIALHSKDICGSIVNFYFAQVIMATFFSDKCSSLFSVTIKFIDLTLSQKLYLTLILIL